MRSIAALALSLLSSFACADQWTLVDSFLPSDFAPGWTTAPGADGFWALGPSDGMAALVRYNADGSVRFLRYPYMPNMQYDGPFKLTAMPDGGVVSTDVEDTSAIGYDACKMRRYDAGGNLLWISDLAQTPLYSGCSSVAVDGTGGIWLFQGYPILVNASDGTQVAQIISPDVPAALIADPEQAAAYVVGASQVNATTTLASVWKITAQGVEWSTSAPAADTDSVLDDVAVAPDGSLWTFGHKNTQLFGMHVAANGSLLWSGAFSTTIKPAAVKVVARADGGASTLHWDSTLYDGSQANWGPELSTVSASGSRLWHMSAGARPPIQAQLYQPSLVAIPDGDVAAAWTYYGGGQPDTNYYLQQTRVNASGTSLFTKTTQMAPPRSGIQIEAFPDYSSLTVTGTFQHFARNGSANTPPTTSAITTAMSYDDNDIMAADGTTYLLVTNRDSKRYGVSAYSSNGSLLWHRSVSSTWTNGGLLNSSMVLRSSDVCVAGFLDGDEMVQCFALADGTPSPKQVLASSLSSSSTLTQAAVTNTDQIVLLYHASDGVMHHALIDVGGNLLHDVTPLQSGETWGASAQGPNGDSIIVTSSSSLLKLGADGSRVYSVPTDLNFRRVVVTSDGGAILSTLGAPVQVERVDSSGQQVWSSTMPSSGPYDFMRSPHFDGSDLYFALTFSGIIYGGAPPPIVDSLVVKLAMANGSIEWSSPLAYVIGFSPRFALNSSGGELFTFSSWNNQTQVHKYAMTDGTLLGGKIEPCKVDQCVLYNALFAPDGTLRMVHDTTDYNSGSLFELTTMENEFDKIFANGFE